MVFEQILEYMLLIPSSPFQKPSLFWQLAPALILWVVMEFYFGFHKEERLGWNTSLGNGISLFWILISCLQYESSTGDFNIFNLGFLILFSVMLYAVFIIVISFTHKFSAKFTYLISSPSPVYYFSIIALLFTYDLLPVNVLMILAVFIEFFVILVIVSFLKHFLPDKDLEEEVEKDREEVDAPEIEEPINQMPQQVPQSQNMPQRGPYQRPPNQQPPRY